MAFVPLTGLICALQSADFHMVRKVIEEVKQWGTVRLHHPTHQKKKKKKKKNILKTNENRKNISCVRLLEMMNTAEKICKWQSTYQYGVCSAHRTDLCFAICRFSPVATVHHLQAKKYILVTWMAHHRQFKLNQNQVHILGVAIMCQGQPSNNNKIIFVAFWNSDLFIGEWHKAQPIQLAIVGRAHNVSGKIQWSHFDLPLSTRAQLYPQND